MKTKELPEQEVAPSLLPIDQKQPELLFTDYLFLSAANQNAHFRIKVRKK